MGVLLGPPTGTANQSITLHFFCFFLRLGLAMCALLDRGVDVVTQFVVGHRAHVAARWGVVVYHAGDRVVPRHGVVLQRGSYLRLYPCNKLSRNVSEAEVLRHGRVQVE